MVRAEQRRAEWESSADDGETARDIVPFGPSLGKDAKDMVAFDVRQRSTGSVLVDLRPRYVNAHGHEGLPPRPRNRHFAGIRKYPRFKRKGRHTYKRS